MIAPASGAALDVRRGAVEPHRPAVPASDAVGELALGRRIAVWPIRLYQRWLSPLKRVPTCRFAPTCSAYAVEAIARRGVLVGLALAVWRVLRCNPFCAGGIDPVPCRHDRGVPRGGEE